MRKIMFTAALAGTAAYAVLSLAGLPAAGAASGSPDCLASGSTCMRIANNNATDGNPIVEGSNINGPAENMTWDAGAQVIRFTSHPGKCLGLNSANTRTVIQPCSGGHGIIQIRVLRGCCGAVAYINNAATQFWGTEEDITAVNQNGTQIGVAAAGAQGGFQRWTK